MFTVEDLDGWWARTARKVGLRHARGRRTGFDRRLDELRAHHAAAFADYVAEMNETMVAVMLAAGWVRISGPS